MLDVPLLHLLRLHGGNVCVFDPSGCSIEPKPGWTVSDTNGGRNDMAVPADFDRRTATVSQAGQSAACPKVCEHFPRCHAGRGWRGLGIGLYIPSFAHMTREPHVPIVQRCCTGPISRQDLVIDSHGHPVRWHDAAGCALLRRGRSLPSAAKPLGMAAHTGSHLRALGIRHSSIVDDPRQTRNPFGHALRPDQARVFVRDRQICAYCRIACRG